MARIDFTDKEQQLLVEIVEGEIPEIRDEIWHTDNHDYRESLKDREQCLKTILAKLTEGR
jgi:hypothetical protein